MKLKLEFTGGAELLFGNVKRHEVDVPLEDGANMTQLLTWIATNLCQERPELFVEGDTVRPGILVLVNETDWELEGQTAYIPREHDEFVFISTLHGG